MGCDTSVWQASCSLSGSRCPDITRRCWLPPAPCARWRASLPRSACAPPIAEGHPIELFWGAITYFPWLFREIAKSGWSVTKVILHPRLPISPTMTVVRASQKTPAGMATYANSITLTPGTITVGVNGSELTVHALVRDGALDLEGGGMDRRVSQFEGTA